MKRILPVIFAISLALSGCSKSDGPGDTEKPIQEVKTGTDIRDKYISLIPDLQKYQHFAEGSTHNQKYKTIGALRGTDVLVAYIDASGKLFSKINFKIDFKSIDRIDQLNFTLDNRTKPSDIASLMFLEKLNTIGESTMPVFHSILYPNNDKLINVNIDVSNLEYKYVSYMNLSYKRFFCYNGSRLLSFNRDTGSLLQNTEVPEDLLIRGITAYYYDDDRMIILYNDSGDIIIKCYDIKSANNSKEPIWQNTIYGNAYLGERGIDITDDQENIIIKLKTPGLEYKFHKSNGESVK
ncbi:hypothetical protein [Sphingobacterium faecium]|jgi:hypothetical protein|uniref:hypothetical protein n=1 Tax=Sphingobacterium faecium TaxID=34087 RepID=UPI00320804B2